MSKSSARPAIRLRGVRHNNLKNFDLDLPLNQLIVVTGLSGSGKSSLAFDTLFAEGQRRYIETFSPYARQFLDRMDKPQVDSIEGIPPSIAIEQRNSVRTTRSTVGTMTEICDYMKLLWPHVAQLHCRQCDQPVRKDPPQQIWQTLIEEPERRKTKDATEQAPVNSTRSEIAAEFLITFNVPLSDKLSLDETIALVAKQGYQRVLLGGRVLRLEEISGEFARKNNLPKSGSKTPAALTIVQDRIKLNRAARARFIEACEQAYHFGKGKLAVQLLDASGAPSESERRFSNRLHCARCDIEYRDPSPALFSFNHPLGACPTCRGFGRIISIDYNLALPDRSKSLAEGAVKPWQTGQSAECQKDLLKMCRHFSVPTNVPFEKLSKKWQDFVIDGEPGYGRDEEHEWPRAWYGIKGYFRWLESKAYKMHVRVLLSRYRAYTPCPTCGGLRLQPDALLYKVKIPGPVPNEHSHLSPPPSASGQQVFTLADFYQLPIRRALAWIERLVKNRASAPNDPLRLALTEVRARLGYLNEVGLGYLTLDRPTRSLSGGETERVSLTTCLGTRLVNTLFVLDEPSVGLHSRDTERLIRVLEQLRDAGNTVLVVEHEASVMRAADHLIDLGPGHGAAGGQVVFQGKFRDILKSPDSLTGHYLSGQKRIFAPIRRPVGKLSAVNPVASSEYGRAGRGCPPEEKPAALGLQQKLATLPPGSSATAILNESPAPFQIRQDYFPALKLTGATVHNLKDFTVEIPLNRFVCVTGVSGSGKTTLIREVLLPALAERLNSAQPTPKASDRLGREQSEDAEGDENPANPGCRLGVLEGAQHLSKVVLVDQSILSKTPRSNPAVYTGAFEDIRELFAQSDSAKRRGLNASAFSFNSSQGQCERCRGAGFEKIEMQFLSDVYIRCPDCDGRRYRAHILEIKLGDSPARSIAELLDATVDEAILFLESLPPARAAQRATKNLKLLQETGLGYLKLGQPLNTLSGGESQRLKLVKHLGDSLPEISSEEGSPSAASPAENLVPMLFLFDEPTTGLHFDDVRVLLKVFQRLVNAGHSVLVIEHNLEVIQACDWIIDLGPEAGDLGGKIVAQGTPEQVSQCRESYTGQALRELLLSSELLPENARASLSPAT
jgi:excinuclease ABC subunit A